MPENKTQANQQIIVAALFALTTNWDDAIERSGRRGIYHTTGAGMLRLRELTEDETQIVSAAAGALGYDLDEDELGEYFSGDFEFQVSFACNRFATASGRVGGQRLTANEVRTLERAKLIIARKETAATTVLLKKGEEAA